MASKCASFVRAKRARITRVDECCRPVCGERAFAVTDGFVSVAYTMEIEEEEELQLKNANGDICVIDTTCPSLKYVSVEIEFCNVDPDIMELTTGQQRILDFTGDAVGQRVGETIRCDGGFALEVWAGTPDADCDDFGDALPNFGYFALPCVINGIMSDFTLENDVATFSVSGRTKRGSGWGRGPFDVVPIDIAGTPGRLLDAWESDKHLHMQLTNVPPPAATCGASDGPEITVQVLTDADGDGTFTDNETAACSDEDVPVRVIITVPAGRESTALENVTLTDGTDTWDLDAGEVGATGPAPGTVIAAGGTQQYDLTLQGWSPANQASKALVANVEHQGETSEMHCQDSGSARVNTITPATNTRFTMAQSTMDACPNPTTMTGSDGTDVTITGGGTCGTSAAGLASLQAGPGGTAVNATRTFAYDGSSDILATADVEFASNSNAGLGSPHVRLAGFGFHGWKTVSDGAGNVSLVAHANGTANALTGGADVFTVAVADGDTATLGVALDRSTNEIVHYRNGAEVARTASAQAAPICGANVSSQLGSGGSHPDPFHYTEWTVESRPLTDVSP